MLQKTAYVTLIYLLIAGSLAAQPWQVISGRLIDKKTRKPIVGAQVTVTDIHPWQVAVTNEQGKFKIDSIPVGTHEVYIEHTDYENFISIVLFTASKPVFLNMELLKGKMPTDDNF